MTMVGMAVFSIPCAVIQQILIVCRISFFDGILDSRSYIANMRGAGEPVFEHDFPPGTDMMKDIREGPMAQERFELELSSRLREDV
jgi:hypothetical protein